MDGEYPITNIKGVGDQLAKKFHKLGIETSNDLIEYYPRKYTDYSDIRPISDIKPGEVTIKASIKTVVGRYSRRGLHITEAIASDDSGSARLLWFNQSYRANSIKKGEQYFISGKFELAHKRLSIMNPSMELASDFPVHTARIVPIYPEIKGLTSNMLRRVLRELMPAIRAIPEPLPDWIIKSHKLTDKAKAVENIHFPASSSELELAKKRLGFEEVFELALASQLNKREVMSEKAFVIDFDEELAKQFVGNLPFKLTDSQRKTIWQIYLDLQKPIPMNRLVEGDVGSGKTVIALMAALMVLNTRASHLDGQQGTAEETQRSVQTSTKSEDRRQATQRDAKSINGVVPTVRDEQVDALSGSGGYQVAFMAPTELLARQHATTITELLKPLGFEHQVGLLVGGMNAKQKQIATDKIKSGDIKLIIGTHTLIQEKIDMHKLGLIIIDEQHRFGVKQRKALQAKAGHMPHVLNMTATPIPRSLALTLYGELDISIIDEKPKDRLPIKTQIYSHSRRPKLNEHLKKEIDNGRQVFVVCPLIVDSEVLRVKSVEKVYESMSKDFKGYKVGLLHGKMKSDEKTQIMQDFIDRKIDILVSTTVIEVGVDVPNASIMVIESVERFGLAQIHQLRGRVGRSDQQGYCYLMLSDDSKPSERISALEELNDGFKLAELDLELRGPGAIYGTMQHGQLDLKVANLADVHMLVNARKTAEEFIEKGENLLQYPYLSARVEHLRTIANLN